MTQGKVEKKKSSSMTSLHYQDCDISESVQQKFTVAQLTGRILPSSLFCFDWGCWFAAPASCQTTVSEPLGISPTQKPVSLMEAAAEGWQRSVLFGSGGSYYYYFCYYY